MHQQLNRKAAGTILERFKRLFPEDAFPIPGQVAKFSVDRLRTAGLSRPKASYIIDLAKRCNAGLIPSVRDCDLLHDEESRMDNNWRSFKLIGPNSKYSTCPLSPFKPPCCGPRAAH